MNRTLNRGLAVVAGVLVLSMLAGLGPRPRDPWVFRCVLDDNPRMVVLALGEDLWASYDAHTCRFDKFWRGDVDFKGSVWDDVHGPQPESVGDTLTYGPLEDRWKLRRSGHDFETTTQFLGYSIIDDQCHLHYRLSGGGGSVRVTEIPEVRVEEDRVIFSRTFRIVDGPRSFLTDVRVRAMVGDSQLTILHNDEPVEDEAEGQQFHRVLLPQNADTVIDVIFDLDGGA